MTRKARLVGYLKPSAEPQGFLLPVFRVEGANCLSVQSIGKDGAVSGFEQIFPEGLRSVPDEDIRTVSVSDPALWGFADRSGITAFERRPELQNRLRSQIVDTKDPFLQLQMARFCEAEADLAKAWQDAYTHLDRYSPRSAQAWRDMVVLPAAIRAAVAEVAQANGFAEDGDYWDDGVETQTRNGRLTLMVIEPLFALFSGNRDARNALERRTSTVREAFGIRTDALAIRRMVDRGPAMSEVRSAVAISDRVIVAIGRMARNLVGTTIGRPSRVPGGRPTTAQMPNLFRTSIEPILVIRNDEVIDQTRLVGDIKLIDLGAPSELLIVFQLGESHYQLLEAACALADQYRRRGTRVVAVIPHLPEPFFSGADAGSELSERLTLCWDALWFLSDRSASVALNTPFGPARSTTAASRHFNFMLELGAAWSEDHETGTLPPTGSEILIVGSARGDRLAPSLFEHATARLIHPEFDFSHAHAALVVARDKRPDHLEALETFADREFPDAELTFKNSPGHEGDYGEVIVAVQGFSTHPASAEVFELLCAKQLAKAGWNVQKSHLADNHDLEAERGDERLFIDCKFDFYDLASGSYDGRVGKKWRDDRVVITTRPVRRRQFLRHVLNGQTTIHYSRINTLRHIHRRRFAHVISALKKDEINVLREVIPACLNWLARQKPITDLLPMPARVELSDYATPEHGPGPDLHLFRLPLVLKPARAGQSIMPAYATAQLILNEAGWRLVSLDPQ